MPTQRKATRNAVGGELSAQQVEKEFATIRDRRPRIERETTLDMIKRYYETHEVEVTKVSLMCPISKARMKIPVRAVNCRHVECIDLRSYLEFHKLLTFWECPFSFCKVEVRCDSLRVDEYMLEILRATDDRMETVEVFADGSFNAVQRLLPTAMETVAINNEDPYVPESGAEPRVKTEANNETPDEPMEVDVFHTDQDQPHNSALAAVDDASLAECGQEQQRYALRETRQQNEALRRGLDSEKDRADKAESDAAKLHEELATKDHKIRELTAKNEELQARLNALSTAAQAIVRMNQAPSGSGSLSKEQDPHEPSSSLDDEDAANEAADAATESGPSAQGESQLDHDDGSASDAPNLLVDLSDASAMVSDSDTEERPKHAPKQHKKTLKGPFACTLCGRMFNDCSNFYKHKRIHTGVKPYKCGQCGKAFSHSISLRAHEPIHTGVRPFKCNQCGKTFTMAVHLSVHERIHTGVRPYKCRFCGQAFAHSNNLRTHERIHTGDKPHKCEACGKEFADSSSLHKHERRMHTGEKPYKCAHCDKAFTTSSELRSHERTYSGDKPYKCDQCGKAFKQSGHLRAHENTHTGDRPYKCGQCGKAFTNSGNLRRHERVHTGEKPYKCGLCGESFTQSATLRKHERTQHAAEDPSMEANKTAAQSGSQSNA